MAAKKDRSANRIKPDARRQRVSRARQRTADPSTKRKAFKQQPAGAAVEALRPLANLSRIWTEIGRRDKLSEFRVSCVRPDDLLVCDFIFENLHLAKQEGAVPKLARKKPLETAVLIVEFPPQSFGEEALLDETGAEVPQEDFPETFKDVTGPKPKPKNATTPAPGEKFKGLAQIKIRMAGPSRIAFNMPGGETELPFTIEAILDACRRWSMRLDVNAVPDPARFRVRREVSFYDVWLGSLVNSSAWTEATKTLVDTLGSGYAKRLAAAARRISTKAAEAIRSGETHELETVLRGAMNEELDVFAERSTSIRDPLRREVAAAALSLMTTGDLTKHRFGQSIFDLLDVLPFVRLIFGPHEPAHDVTALELPYRLVLSPVPESRWHHATKAVTRNGRTELWHSRLTSSKEDVGPDGKTNVRTLWSDDYKPTKPPDIITRVNGPLPFRMSLDALDREMLVKLMAGFDEEDTHRHPFHPHTAQSRRLALSSLGALLDVEGEWDPPVPKGVGLEQWRHLATLGRDHYVRVVYRGFLCNPRHAASLIKVTERKFESVPNSKNRVAVLRQKFFIIVRERVKHYDGTGHHLLGRNYPFTEVEILTRVTPTLVAPDQGPCMISDQTIYKPKPAGNGIPHRACFWPMINSTTNFSFDIAATDLSGRVHTFSMPLLFVGSEANENPDALAKILEAYRKEKITRRNTSFGGASVCYAPFDPAAKGDTRLPTSEMTFKVGDVDPGVVSTDEARFYPEIEKAKVGVGEEITTWIPSSAPPPAPEVLYVLPTFGWVRSEDETGKKSWRRGGGLRVYLNRPWNVSGYGEMLAVVLPPANFPGDPNKEPPPTTLKKFVTQWGNDPIWLSLFVAGVAPKRSNFPLARTSRDPDGKWLPGFAPADEWEQPPGPFRTSLQPSELRTEANPPFVEIAPHDVFYDEERQLWYCDMEVTWGAAYFPFIRLALARYQPVSVDTAHLSNIVIADFMPLVPDRWLSVSGTRDARTKRVLVFGNTYEDSSGHHEAHGQPGAAGVTASSVVLVWLERLEPSLGEDFGWQRESRAVIQRDNEKASPGPVTAGRLRAMDLVRHREFEALIDENLIDRVFITPTLWQGSVTLPESRDPGARYRLVIAEYEEYLVDDDKPYEAPATKKERRLVFVEHIELR